MSRLTKEEAMEGLHAMREDAWKYNNETFTLAPLLWRGRRVDEALLDIIEALEAEEPVVHPKDEICGCGHMVESHDEQGCVLCGYRCKEAYEVRG